MGNELTTSRLSAVFPATSDNQSAYLWNYMDSRSWWESLPEVTEFIGGDIFIEKCYGEAQKTTEAIFRAGQAALSHGSSGSSNSAHALILLQPLELGDLWTAEASGQCGLIQCLIRGGDFTVYRCKSTYLRQRAVEIATFFSQSSPGFSPGGYASRKCALSVLKSKTLGTGARQYLNNLARIYDLKDYNAMVGQGSEVQAVGDDMYCSEFVMAVYELAYMKGPEGELGLFGVDPRALSVKAMEAQLNGNPEFELKGRFTH